MTALLSVLGVVVVGVFTAVVSVVVAKINASATARTTTTPTWADMADRLEKVEDKLDRKSAEVDELKARASKAEAQLEAVTTDRAAIMRYVADLADWFQGGAKPPAPTVPPALLAHVPPDAFEHARITSRTTTTTTQYGEQPTPHQHDDESGE